MLKSYSVGHTLKFLPFAILIRLNLLKFIPHILHFVTIKFKKSSVKMTFLITLSNFQDKDLIFQILLHS